MSNKTIDIGFVTVLYNCDEVLPDFFKCLSQQKGDLNFKLYIIDNSAKNTGAELSRQLSEQYKIDAIVVFNNFNGGVAKGNNQGIKLALKDGCEYVLIGNNDTEFPPETFQILLSKLKSQKAAAITPKIYFYGTDLLWYAGGHINPWLMRTPHRGLMEKDTGQYDTAEYVGYAPTCFMLVASEWFSKMQWMDEKYFCYYDDTDFVWRLIKSGGKLFYEPSSVVHHKVSTSTGGDESPFSLRYMNRNRAYFIRKNLSGFQKIFALSYMFLTRIFYKLKLKKKLSDVQWRGFVEGLKLPLENQ